MHRGPSGAVRHESITWLTLLKVGDFRKKVCHTYVCANNTDEFALVITRQCYGCYQTCWQKTVVNELPKIMNEIRNYHSLNMVNKNFETSNFVLLYGSVSKGLGTTKFTNLIRWKRCWPLNVLQWKSCELNYDAKSLTIFIQYFFL